jgi:hemoglobin/transferrin/lactoferrin receptor protein
LNENTYKVKTKKNIGNAFIRGFEASIDYSFHPHLSFHSNISTTYGQNTTNNEPVGGIPPTFGLIGMKWRRETMNVDLYIRFASKQDRLSADDMDDPRIPVGGTPSWYTINFRSGFHLQHSANFQLAVENILDTNYREHGSGVNGPGRNFIVSLEVKP